MAKKHRKKGHARHALGHRYGHFGMKDLEEGAAGIKRLVSSNPLIAAAAAGAGVGALSAGMSPSSAAAVGAVAGVAIQQAMKK